MKQNVSYKLASLVVALAASPLYFCGLGDVPLWQDEGHTALLGRHTLRSGLPYVGHGADSASALAGKDAGMGGLFLHIPPLQAYLVAASFGLFGESAWAARLPFALCGWLCVLLVPWALRGNADGQAAFWSQVAVALHVPFLLHMRQCRYYAAAALLSLVVFGLALRLGDGRARRRHAVALAAALSLLVLTYEFAWAAAAAVAFLSVAYGGFRHRSWRAAVGPMAAIVLSGLVAVAWLWLAATAPSRHHGPGSNVNPNFPEFPWYYLGVINGYGVPILWLSVLLVPAIAVTIRSWTRRDHVWARLRGLWRIALLGTVQTAALCVVCMYTRNGFPRYVVPVFPVAIMAAVALVRIALRVAGPAELIAMTAAGVVLASGQWSFRTSGNTATFWPWERWLEARTGVTWSRRNEVHLGSFIKELRQPPTGPVAACVRFLTRVAEPGEILVAEYSEKPLKFHTKLRVYGGETGAYPNEPPDWIWVRPFLRLWGEVQQTRHWITTHVDLSKYDRIVIRGVFDSLWENRPHPEWHVFEDSYRAKFPHTRPSLILYRRRR